LWHSIDRFWIPLVGQIIVKPRWFSPAVTGLWVQAAHDGRNLSLRVSWNDRSNSPDPEWAEWRARIAEVMEPHEGDAAAADAPDALAVWFPRHIPAGMERPYFFMGNARDPVYLWRWQSPGEATEMQGRGPGILSALPTGNGLAAQSVFEDGQWRVLFHRPLTVMDSANAIALRVGQPIPVAFFASDGDNAEDGTRGSLSTWYFVYLGEPTSNSVYLTPLVATLLTAGLGLFVVRRAQKRERERDLTRTEPAEP
jgi:DMSO reductase family type II enzyme heme b subunit